MTSRQTGKKENIMKRSVAAALALALAGPASAGGTITNPSMASYLNIDLLGGQLPRMMISYQKSYGAAEESILWDVYGTFRITYMEPTRGYLYTTHNITDQMRLMIAMSGDELARFKDCLAVLAGNQNKREIVQKMTPPQAISPWAQFTFMVEPGSGADSALRNWAFTDLTRPNVTIPIQSQPASHFVGCTTNF
jgi:hypothetical protein